MTSSPDARDSSPESSPTEMPPISGCPELTMTETVQPSPAQKRRAVWIYRTKIMVALALPIFLETLDYTVVATAQPHIASAFNRLNLQSYIGTTYVLTSTVFLPIFASFADIFGRYWAIQLSSVLFLLGCALSTGAQNMPMMLAGRGIAGVGAAGLLTVVRVILSDSASLNDNNFQASILVVLYAVGYSVGPYIGGALTSISFRWVFGINLPCTVASMILCFILLRGIVKPSQPRRFMAKAGVPTNIPTDKEGMPEKFLRIDTIGALLFIVGGILILLGLNWGSTLKWDDGKVIASLVIGIALLVAFIGWEWFAERDEIDTVEEIDTTEKIDTTGSIDTIEEIIPSRSVSWTRPEAMIPLEIFKSYDVCATQYAAFACGLVMLVNFYFLAIFFTIVLNKSPASSGLQLIYFAPGMGAGVLISIQLIMRLRQPKIPIVIGMALVPIGLGFLALAMQLNNQGMVDGFLVLCGVGIGMSFGPLAIHARFSQPEDKVAIVVSLNLFFRTFGGTVGLAQCGAVLNSKVNSYIKNLVASGTLSPEQIQQLASLGSINSIQAISNLPPELAQHVRDAYRSGVRWAFISLIPWTASAAIMVLFLSKIPDTDLRPPPAGADPESDGHPVITNALTERAASMNDTLADPPKETKPRIYGPISLVIHLVKKESARKLAAAANRQASMDSP